MSKSYNLLNMVIVTEISHCRCRCQLKVLGGLAKNPVALNLVYMKKVFDIV